MSVIGKFVLSFTFSNLLLCFEGQNVAIILAIKIK